MATNNFSPTTLWTCPVHSCHFELPTMTILLRCASDVPHFRGQSWWCRLRISFSFSFLHFLNWQRISWGRYDCELAKDYFFFFWTGKGLRERLPFPFPPFFLSDHFFWSLNTRVLLLLSFKPNIEERGAASSLLDFEAVFGRVYEPNSFL